MRSETRFVLAIALMIGILVATNFLFPPIPPDPATTTDSTATVIDSVVGAEDTPSIADLDRPIVSDPELPPAEAPPADAPPETEIPPERQITVEGPLYRYVFSSRGARLLSAELLQFQSFAREGPVQLVPDSAVAPLGQRVVVGSDTLDLREAPFEASRERLTLSEGGGEESLTFRYEHPSGALSFEVTYTFDPATYIAGVSGRLTGLDDAILITDLGSGIAVNEARAADDVAAFAYVAKHQQDGIRSEGMDDVSSLLIEPGPYDWVAFKSKFFVTAVLAGSGDESNQFFGGLLASPHPGEQQTYVGVAQTFRSDGTFERRMFFGPQDLARLSSLGQDLEDVNPYGWRFFRPIIRPFTGIITFVLVWMHETLHLAYGWVLVVFGVLMRVVLFPLHQKSMRAQLRNMAVQPRIKEIQSKYKDKPEKQRDEMLKLYKEEGFNPLAGCLPMLIPWPVLIALFFVFQNTIELRGVPFMWLPDLSAPDPLYILPVFMGLSMFVLQWIGFRSLEDSNPQMKMMMYFMPIMMLFIFANLPSGLNLYYSTVNVAMIPQQMWIAGERKKVKAKPPPKLSED
jgi:YidC/Oxa1 family membrane protein insertase